MLNKLHLYGLFLRMQQIICAFQSRGSGRELKQEGEEAEE